MNKECSRNMDFQGWLIKDHVKAEINAIENQKVPLVFLHGNGLNKRFIIGHVFLEIQNEGLYAYGCFDKTNEGEIFKKMLLHGDVSGFSILVKDNTVFEIGLELAGATPGIFSMKKKGIMFMTNTFKPCII